MPKSLVGAVREKVDAGMLPLNDPAKLWVGRGNGYRCAVCEQAILKSQIEYEPQYDDGLPLVLMHAGCHRVWEAERRRRGDARLIGKI